MGAKGGYKDLTNQIYGDWKVIRFDNTKGKYKYYWECVCINCGNMKSIASASLLNENKSKRCELCNENFGLKKEEDIKGYAIDITGNKYGEFTIKGFSHKKHSHSHWIGVCACGNEEIHSIGFYTREFSIKKCESCKRRDLEFKAIEYNKKLQKEKENIKQFKEENKELFLVRKKFNKYEFKDNHVIINERILIDVADFEMIDGENRYISINCSGYANITKYDEQIFIHRLIMGLPNTYDPKAKLIVDHINGDKLDNRRCNLRIVKKELNPINCKKYKNNTSGVKGVSWNKKLSKWQVNINVNKKTIYLGVYSDFEEAVKIRKEAEYKYFGDMNRK